MEWDFYIHRAGSSSSAESIQGRYIKIGMQRWRWSPVYFYESCSVAFLCASSFVPWEKVFFGGISASRDVVITRFITGFKAWRSSLGLESVVLHRHDSTVAQKGQTQHSWLLRGPLRFEQPCRRGHTRGATTSLDATKCSGWYKEKKCFVFWHLLNFVMKWVFYSNSPTPCTVGF